MEKTETTGDLAKEDSERDDYRCIFALLDQLSLSELKNKFRKEKLQDDTIRISFDNSKEFKQSLKEDLGLPLGDALKISTVWFKKFQSGNVPGSLKEVHPTDSQANPTQPLLELKMAATAVDKEQAVAKRCTSDKGEISGGKKGKESNQEETSGDIYSVDEKHIELTSSTSERSVLQNRTIVTDVKEVTAVETGACSESEENKSTLHTLSSARSKSYDDNRHPSLSNDKETAVSQERIGLVDSGIQALNVSDRNNGERTEHNEPILATRSIPQSTTSNDRVLEKKDSNIQGKGIGSHQGKSDVIKNNKTRRFKDEAEVKDEIKAQIATSNGTCQLCQVPLPQEDVLGTDTKESIKSVVAENQRIEIKEDKNNFHILPSLGSTSYEGGHLETLSNDKETAISQERNLSVDNGGQALTVLDRNHNEKTDYKDDGLTLGSIAYQKTCFQMGTAFKREEKEGTQQLVFTEEDSGIQGIGKSGHGKSDVTKDNKTWRLDREVNAKEETEDPNETSSDEYQVFPNEHEDVLTCDPKELITLIVAENQRIEIREDRSNLHTLPSLAGTSYKGETLSNDKETPISQGTYCPESSGSLAANVADINNVKETVHVEMRIAAGAISDKTTPALVEQNESKYEEHETNNRVLLVSKMNNEAVSQEQSLEYSLEKSNEEDKALEKLDFQVERVAVIQEESIVESSECLRCPPRPFGTRGRDFYYLQGKVLDTEESKEVEFKSFAGESINRLPWKMMEKVKKFVCGCLNANRSGIIHFGVGDNQEQDSKFKRGEVIGLDIENARDEIVMALQCVLDDHLKSDEGALQKGGDQDCIRLEFVPVIKDGQRTGLYVVEFEVSRDWKFCKDGIYHQKKWTEKRRGKNDKEDSSKKGLHDFYKVHKDDFDDVVIRTNGATVTVKQHEVKKQVQEPLTIKYKEWRKESKPGSREQIQEINFDDADVKRYSTITRERLHDLNWKEYRYILIANKLPPEYRDTPALSFLQNIPWTAVFDLFDPASRKDGLHYVCNETTDAPRPKVVELEDLKDVTSHLAQGKEEPLSSKGTTWILRGDKMQEGDWIKNSKDYLYQALAAYKNYLSAERMVFVFLGLSENATAEMSDILESCFSILGDSASKSISIFSEQKSVVDALVRSSKHTLRKEIRECSISGIPWTLLKENVREMIGFSKFEERGATTELPYYTGEYRKVLNKKINSWDDLEVYSPNPKLSDFVQDIAKARDSFYRGDKIQQLNLFHNHDIPRSAETEVRQRIDAAVKSLEKPITEAGCHVKTVIVPYESGSGATTLCRRILWNMRREYRCAVVKAVTPATDHQIEQLQRTMYDEKNIAYAPPVIVLMDNFHENETRRLRERIANRQFKCLILSTVPIVHPQAEVKWDVTPLGQLDHTETALVKDILINITNDSERQRGAEEVLEREKRFIWFGLELFGRNYVNIEDKLKTHIESVLGQSSSNEKTPLAEMVLNFCCLLHYYSDNRKIFPNPIVSDFLYQCRTDLKNVDSFTTMDEIHDLFGGLLLEGFDETHGYYGWRPAHALVGKVVIEKMNLEESARFLLEKSFKHEGKAYVVKYLVQDIVKVLLDRRRISDAVVLTHLEDFEDINSDLELEVFGYSAIRTRYSPLICDIVAGKDGIRTAMTLLIMLCEYVKQNEDKAYAWQQLARFIGYEVGPKTIEVGDQIFKRMLTAVKNQGRDNGCTAPLTTGIEAAHRAIDVAISYQPNYSHHYGTKGELYKLYLRTVKEQAQSSGELSVSLLDVTRTCRQAVLVYDKALEAQRDLNLYALIGKIQVIIELLVIIKTLPCFQQDQLFAKYLNREEMPLDVTNLMPEEEHEYVHGRALAALDFINQIFRRVSLRQKTSYEEGDGRTALNDERIRASKLRRKLYEVCGYDRSDFAEVEVPSSPFADQAPSLMQEYVEDALFKNDENPYSAWTRMLPSQISIIYNLLKGICERGYGGHDTMLTCCKACLQMAEKPPVEELLRIVEKWLEKSPNSEWANLFNYMVHFPIPNGSLATNLRIAKSSISKCYEIVTQSMKRGSRKSGADYLLGKGIGLNAFVPNHELPSRHKPQESKTDFWRRKEISYKLERLRGQKNATRKGMIDYQGIHIRFDDSLYPKESKDDLWFYVGFSLTGPYAYDPIDSDDYATITKTMEHDDQQFASFPLSEMPSNSGGETLKKTAKNTSLHVRHQAKTPWELHSSPGRYPLKTGNYQQTSKDGLVPQVYASENAQEKEGPLTGNYSAAATADSGQQTPSYAAVVQDGSQVPRLDTRSGGVETPRLPSPVSTKPTWRQMSGRQGKKSKTFRPTHEDQQGRLHHGAWMVGGKKSKDCEKHKSGDQISQEALNSCNFAHYWCGDTVQYICQKCTNAKKHRCSNYKDHQHHKWNLGVFYSGSGELWKEDSN